MNLVKLSDLDDYLNPAQDCVVMSTDTKSKQNKVSNGKVIMLEDEFETKQTLASVKKPNLIKMEEGTDKGTVNLYDCLACSGCVTSSEVVLMEVSSLFLTIATRSEIIDQFVGKGRGRDYDHISTEPSSTLYRAQFGSP